MPIKTLQVSSSVSTVPSRDIRVFTPPGYDTSRRQGYPVLYMHDGQNVFAPGSAFGCWHAEQVACDEIAAGRIPPLVIAAIDNDGDNRRREYVPPSDRFRDLEPGTADRYLAFVMNDVLPAVQQHFNVTGNRSQTGIMGSSLGGVVSLYIGLETDAFGLVGSLSTAICHAPGFLADIPGRATKLPRIYHDIGTGEYTEMQPDDYKDAPRILHRNLLAAGLREPEELAFVIDRDARHHESAWHRRLPQALRWLYGTTNTL